MKKFEVRRYTEMYKRYAFDQIIIKDLSWKQASKFSIDHNKVFYEGYKNGKKRIGYYVKEQK